MNKKKIIGISGGLLAIAIVAILVVTLVLPDKEKPLPVSNTGENSSIASENNTADNNVTSTEANDVVTTSDYEKIFEAINKFAPSVFDIRQKYMDGGMVEESIDRLESVDMDAPAPASEAASGLRDVAGAGLGSAPASDYSQTNIQVQGVDEADVIKTDGEYIYAINTEALYIIKANKGKPELMSKISTIDKESTGEFYIEMYLHGDRVIAIKNNVYQLQPYDSESSKYGPEEQKTHIDVFDVKDKEKPVKVESLTQSGYYKHSRMIDEYLYLATDFMPMYNVINRNEPRTFVPCYTTGVKEEVALPNDIAIMPENNIANYTVISGIKTTGDVDFVSKKSILGESFELYASSNNFYLTSTQYNEDLKEHAKYNAYYYSEDTLITKLSVNKGNVEVKTSAKIPGRILDQFSLDEYKGTLRVVTTVFDQVYYNPKEPYYNDRILDELITRLSESNGSKESSTVITLDENLKTIATIDDIAPGEQVFSCRFMGDIAYFVTFRQVDPLFSVDLSDPNNPKIIGKLKIPGFSEYLHPYDNGLLFGLGRNADEEGRTDFLKLSMFDNSDPKNVTEKDMLIINDMYYSEASYNHKAILVDARKSLIAFPADNAYLIYTYDKKNGFKQEAEIILSEDGWITSEFLRGLFIDDIFYVISSNTVNAYDMKDGFAKLGTVELPNEAPLPIMPVPLPTPRGGTIDIIE